MMTRNLLRMALLGTTLATAGCGVTYHSPTVKEQGAEVAVREVPLTAQSVLVANRAPYSPRKLPSAFYQIAGGGSLRFAGALPEAPYVPEERHRTLELRPPAQILPDPYRIGVGDVVLLATKAGGSTVEELTGLLAAQSRRQGYTVRDDGRIAIPDIGQIDIAGLTLEEAEAKVFDTLVKNQIDPAFSLEVSEFNSQRVAVGGAVASARLLPITLQPLTLGDALTAAGGITARYEEFTSIRIYRDGSLYQIPVEDFFADAALQRRLLQDGDAVYVDTSYDLDKALAFYKQKLDVISQRSSARSQALSELQGEIGLRSGILSEQRANFKDRQSFGAEKRDYVYVTGEVRTQSRFPLPYDQQATLADVLYEGGGFATATGNPRHLYVLRASDNPTEFGAVTAWHLDASNAVNITVATRMEMRPNDIIFIEEQPITKWNRALQQTFGLFGGAAGVANAVVD